MLLVRAFKTLFVPSHSIMLSNHVEQSMWMLTTQWLDYGFALLVLALLAGASSSRSSSTYASTTATCTTLLNAYLNVIILCTSYSAHYSRIVLHSFASLSCSNYSQHNFCKPNTNQSKKKPFNTDVWISTLILINTGIKTLFWLSHSGLYNHAIWELCNLGITLCTLGIFFQL